jgi:hypothetical protein
MGRTTSEGEEGETSSTAWREMRGDEQVDLRGREEGEAWSEERSGDDRGGGAEWTDDENRRGWDQTCGVAQRKEGGMSDQDRVIGSAWRGGTQPSPVLAPPHPTVPALPPAADLAPGSALVQRCCPCGPCSVSVTEAGTVTPEGDSVTSPTTGGDSEHHEINAVRSPPHWGQSRTKRCTACQHRHRGRRRGICLAVVAMVGCHDGVLNLPRRRDCHVGRQQS